jgi:virulence-associated protein VapD
MDGIKGDVSESKFQWEIKSDDRHSVYQEIAKLLTCFGFYRVQYSVWQHWDTVLQVRTTMMHLREICLHGVFCWIM